MTHQSQPPLNKQLPTPICANTLLAYLWAIKHHDTNFLYKGFTEGFRIGYTGNPHSLELSNHKSFAQHRDYADQYLKTELAANRIAGPYSEKPHGLVVSPLGLIPKGTTNEFRVIQDFSMPKSAGSINSGIDDVMATVSYEQYDHVARIIADLGKGTFISKVDIKSAYRICPVSPLDYSLLGFKIGALYFHDKVLTMGCRSSCQIFERFSTALRHIMVQFYAVHNISHILDDFIFMGNKQECGRGLSAFHHLADKISLPLKHQKTVQPTTSAVVHGILVNTDTMTASLPADKLQRINNLLSDILQRRRIQLKLLLSIIGLLQFASNVTPGGRCFLRRLIDLTCGVTNNNHYIRLTKSAKADLRMWQEFMSNHTGTSLLLDYKWNTTIRLSLETDSAKTRGYAAVLNSTAWCYGKFSEEFSAKHITLLEFIPVVIALHLWVDYFKNSCVSLATDNMGLVYIINKQTSKSLEIMILVRKLVLCLLKNNVILRAHHISSSSNALSDAISRFNLQKARQLQPGLNTAPTEIPQSLQPYALLHES